MVLGGGGGGGGGGGVQLPSRSFDLEAGGAGPGVSLEPCRPPTPT